MTNLLDLPNELLISILNYLSYENISKIRIVCKRFDEIGKELLNDGFKRSINNYFNVLDIFKKLNANNNDWKILKSSEFFTTSIDITIIGNVIILVCKLVNY